MYSELEVFFLNAVILCGQLLEIQEAIVLSEYQDTNLEFAETAV